MNLEQDALVKKFRELSEEAQNLADSLESMAESLAPRETSPAMEAYREKLECVGCE